MAVGAFGRHEALHHFHLRTERGRRHQLEAVRFEVVHGQDHRGRAAQPVRQRDVFGGVALDRVRNLHEFGVDAPQVVHVLGFEGHPAFHVCVSVMEHVAAFHHRRVDHVHLHDGGGVFDRRGDAFVHVWPTQLPCGAPRDDVRRLRVVAGNVPDNDMVDPAVFCRRQLRR